MKKFPIILFFFFLFVFCINAQIPFSLSNSFNFVPSGKSNITTAESYYITHSEENENTINLYYKNSILGYEELATYGLSGNYVLSERLQLYLGFGYFGFDLMNELNVTSAISFNSENLSIGLAGQFNRAFIRDFSSEGIFTFDLFGKVFTDDFSIGFLLNNINQAQYSNYKNTIQQRAIFSLGYEFSEQISADIGTEIIINNKSTMLFGAKYQPVEELALNMKFFPNTNKITFGLSITPINWIKMNFFFNHQQLFGSDYYFINQIKW